MDNNKSQKILIIDDDPTLLLIAERKISQQGYQVLTTALGQEGIDMVFDQSPDLLLLDYELPDMTGIEVCQKIRNQINCIDIPILFITGKDDYQTIENAFQAGATDFSSKPLNWNILIYRIQYLLRAHEIYQSLLASEVRLIDAHKVAKIANWEYSKSDDQFKWSNTLFDLLEIDRQQRDAVFGLKEFLLCVPLKDVNRIQQAINNCLSNKVNFELEHELVTARGNKKIILHLGRYVKVHDASTQIDFIGTLKDITEQRNSDEQIRTLAYYDSLTGLMNRESFLSALDKLLISLHKHQLLSALLFIDLDDFKRVNDTLGHSMGDLLLCEVSERFEKCLSRAEKEKAFSQVARDNRLNLMADCLYQINSINLSRFSIARLGGDEFVVFLTDIPDRETAASIAERLLKTLEPSFDLDGQEVYLGCSIGVAISPQNGRQTETLLKNADIAMFSSKENGKNKVQFYTQQMNDSSLYQLTMESDLRNAIAHKEFYLVYQPQFYLQTGKLAGVEALMRWNHNTLGEISPVEFIPIAEQTGQILVMGKWLFEQLSAALLHWKQEALIPEKFKLAINVSSLQFHQPDMMSLVSEYFSDPELNKHVEFELTETVMMKDVSQNLKKLNMLAAKNITLSIDDFGTGYSSLSYLHRFPVDTVKIDRSFIMNMQEESQISIVKAIVSMAHSMDIKVIAEGIENQQQLDFLTEENCDIGQGFLLSKPLRVEKFDQLLRTNSER